MKKLFILAIVLLTVACSSENEKQTEQPQKCYTIISRGYDERGDFIIIKYANYTNKRYQVNNYLDWISQTELCEPINLTEQQL